MSREDKNRIATCNGFLHAHHKSGWGFFLTLSLPTPIFIIMKDNEGKNVMSNIKLEDSMFSFSNHNGIQCIEKLDATRPCDRKWFTARQLFEWAEVSEYILRKKIELLAEKSRISLFFNRDKNTKVEENTDVCEINLIDSIGNPHKTQIYNLNVLNQLAMICIESDKLNNVSKAFSDIISEVETTGSYSIKKKSPKEEKEEKENELILMAVKNSNPEVRMIALGNLKDLWTDTANRRAFSAMGTASAKSKENTKLRSENEDLKARLQESTTFLCVKAIPWLSKYFIIPKEKESESVYSVVGKKLTAISKKLNYEIKNIPTSQFPKGVGAYHVDIIEIFRKQLDNDNSLLLKYRK